MNHIDYINKLKSLSASVIELDNACRGSFGVSIMETPTVYVDGKIPFHNFKEHLEYIYDNYNYKYNLKYDTKTNTYIDGRGIYIISPSREKRLYHGTSLDSFFKILEDGCLNPINNNLVQQRGIDDIEYNLVFFSDDPYTCMQYGKTGGANTSAKTHDEYVLLEFDLSDFEVYNIKRDEYCVWGKIDIKYIKSILVYDSELDTYNIIPFIPPEISLYDYDKYKARIPSECYLEGIHGISHIKRVLYLALKIAEHEGITDEEIELLANGAIYHDIGRENDFADISHGIDSYDKGLRLGLIKDNPYLRFIIECHCVDDDISYALINNNAYILEDKERALKLYRILKDADNLDRVRINDLNESYLRLEYSKELVETAWKLLDENL